MTRPLRSEGLTKCLDSHLVVFYVVWGTSSWDRGVSSVFTLVWHPSSSGSADTPRIDGERWSENGWGASCGFPFLRNTTSLCDVFEATQATEEQNPGTLILFFFCGVGGFWLKSHTWRVYEPLEGATLETAPQFYFFWGAKEAPGSSGKTCSCETSALKTVSAPSWNTFKASIWLRRYLKCSPVGFKGNRFH